MARHKDFALVLGITTDQDIDSFKLPSCMLASRLWTGEDNWINWLRRSALSQDENKTHTKRETRGSDESVIINIIIIIDPTANVKIKKKTFLLSVGSCRPFSPPLVFQQSSVQSDFRSSNIREFTGFPPLKLFYKNMMSDLGRRCWIWSHRLIKKSTKIQSGYVHIHLYIDLGLSGIEALYIHTSAENSVQSINQSNTKNSQTYLVNNINTWIGWGRSQNTHKSFSEIGLHFPACTWSLHSSASQQGCSHLGWTLRSCDESPQHVQ